ncbi:MAG: AhpC/TSA family protein [Phycisphaerales bacterium]|nr:AhpC/TSA family protein [Phycisphaerales bacterium]
MECEPCAARQKANAAGTDTQRGLLAGDRAPDATLQAADGQEVQLADVYARGPVVLAFYRGGWCPYCANELKEWQDRLEELRDLGGELIAITPESPGFASQTAGKHGLGFTVLSDARGEAAARFDLGFTLDARTRERYRGLGIDLEQVNAQKNWDLVIPATYLIDEDGVIRYAYVNEDYTKRARPDEVLAALRRLE